MTLAVPSPALEKDSSRTRFHGVRLVSLFHFMHEAKELGRISPDGSGFFIRKSLSNFSLLGLESNLAREERKDVGEGYIRFENPRGDLLGWP